ncbi:MAG: RDD family protein [Vicinamibacteria bacterium]|nr:RDD family protein [Vicinamibacteria bacterium]
MGELNARRGRVVVTPEHVEIVLEPAGLGNRFLALLVDFVLLVALAGVLAQISLLFLPLGIAGLVRGLTLLVLGWGYHVYFEIQHQGQSPGKRLFGLRVVDGRGLPLAIEQSFIRNAVRALDVLPLGYAVGALICLMDREHRRLGDIAADTLVVREPRHVAGDRRLTRERVFNSLRVPRVLRLVRHRVNLEEREFLATLCLRADALDAGARLDLMEEVAAFYRRRLEIDDIPFSGESFVRGLVSILFADRLPVQPRFSRS